MNFDTSFVNQKVCLENGIRHNLSPKEFLQSNKKYYQETEDYDWVEVTDKHKGLEAILHRLRERKTLKLVKQFGGSGKILDAGCGTGLILRHLPKGSVGLDINPRNIKRAKIHAPQAELVVGDIEKIPFSNASFGMVICTEIFEHLPSPTKALEEVFRVTMPGGVLIGSVPSVNLFWKLRLLSSTHPGEPYHKLYKREEISELFPEECKILELEKGCFGMSLFFVIKYG